MSALIVPENMLPLSIAAQKLCVSRERAARLLFRGVLAGEQRDGRWFVTAKSVERAGEQLARPMSAA